MIIYHRTSILESTAKTAVNTVNCVGVMGKGLAHAYKKRYPKMFTQYKKFCDAKLFEPGKLWLWKAEGQWILNFPTKKHWRNSSKIEWIEQGLIKFADTYEAKGINHISFPKLGCGNGGLNWDEVVRPIMEKHLNPLPIEIWVHDFQVEIGLPEHLEHFASSQEDKPLPKSKNELWDNIKLIEASIGTQLLDFDSKTSFELRTKNNDLILTDQFTEAKVDFEELLSNYRVMLGGLLTRKKVGISDSGEAGKLISLLSFLPKVEAVQIGFPDKIEHQTAAQIRFLAGYETASQIKEQFDLWG